MSDRKSGDRPAIGNLRDLVAGGVLVAIGIWAIAEGSSYGFGTLRVVGSGAFPVITGACLVLTGTVIGFSAGRADTVEEEPFERPDLRLIACVVAGMALFALLAETAGLVVATAAAGFVVCAGVRENSLRDTGIFAAGITVGAVLLFHFLLGVQLPLFGSWFGSY